MKAVSERFISAAIFCIDSSDSVVLLLSTHTPAGLPENGESVNASTVNMSTMTEKMSHTHLFPSRTFNNEERVKNRMAGRRKTRGVYSNSLQLCLSL